MHNLAIEAIDILGKENNVLELLEGYFTICVLLERKRIYC